MGESFTVPAHDLSNPVLPQPTPSLVTDEDDEPPSSGTPRYGPSQMTEEPKDGLTPETQQNPSTHAVDDTPGAQGLSLRPTRPTSSQLSKSSQNGPPECEVSDLEKNGTTEKARPAAGGRRQRRLMIVKLSAADRFRRFFSSVRPAGPQPTYRASFKAILNYSFLNVLLLLIPVSWALHHTHQSPTLVFVVSGLGIIPLAALLGFGTEQIALRTTQSVGGLLNASLGNLIEMIISGIALKQCQLEVVQSTLLGGLLSNLLLVLGCAFLIGGFRFNQQQFQPMVAQLNSSLLIVSVVSLTIPTAFASHQYLEDRLPQGKEAEILVDLSRISAIILILIYVAYLFFQFYSHNHLFLDTLQEYSISTRSSRSSRASGVRRHSIDSLPPPSSSSSSSYSSSSDEETPKINIYSAITLLVVITALAYVTAEYFVDSLEGLVEAHPAVSKEWITLIIIPIISNAAEHATAVIVASKGKFDLAMSVAVGSCIQIALFVIPVLVCVAWGMGKPLTLLFDPLETVVLFLSVLLVKFSVEDGKSHWMSGFVLIAVYILIAIAFWHFPGDTVRLIQGQGFQCFK